MTTSIKEIQTMTPSEARYRIYERMEEMYESNSDWLKVMACKWSLLINQGGN